MAGRRKTTKPKEKEVVTLEMFPEGGKLVANTRNSLLIVSSREGSGTLRDKNDNVVLNFNIGELGFSRLNFVPQPNESYHLSMDKTEHHSASIDSMEDGLSMQVISLGECSPIQLHLNAPMGSPLLNEELYLISAAYGVINYAKVFTLSAIETTSALIPYRSLRDGLNQLYIVNSQGVVIASRIYFLDPLYAQVQINVPKELLNPRDSVEIKINLSDYFGNPIRGEFGVSVTNQELFDRNDRSVSLRNELFLFNDLPSLKRYFEMSKSSEDDWMKQINDLLISQRWQRADWEKILGDRQDDNLTFPYKKALSFTGQVLLKESGLPLNDSSMVSIYQDGAKIVYSTHTTSYGSFDFQLINDYWNHDKFYFKVDPINPKVKIPDYYIESEMILKQKQTNPATFSDQVDTYGEYVHNKRIIDDSYRAYLQSSNSLNSEKVMDPNTPYLVALGGADVDVTISDFVIFPSMEDLVHEVVGGLQYRKIRGERSIRVPIFSGGYTKIPQDDPLFIVNGMLTLDTESFLNLKADEVVYIKLVNGQNKLSKFGSFGQNGVVLVLTNEKELDEQSLRSKCIALAGINAPFVYKPHNPSGLFASSIPDLKSTQYWVPNYSNSNDGSATIKFKLSDDLGPMLVSVGGVTFDGNPFSGSTVFTVTNPRVIYFDEMQ